MVEEITLQCKLTCTEFLFYIEQIKLDYAICPSVPHARLFLLYAVSLKLSKNGGYKSCEGCQL